MKKWTRNLLALVLAVALVGCGSALAAEETAPGAEPVVAVQLDGQNLGFTDAVPQVKDQRTFLPFRAVFEAMGAEVGYEGMTITAKRGEKALTMTIGSPNAVVVENGVETPIVMDVAPYVDNTTWRTYVPVRFAAQAFGCNVGWDQANYTAIIVDTEKLMDEVLKDKSFTYLEKYLEYSKKYQSGIWDMDVTFDAGTNHSLEPMFAGTMKGTVQGSEKMDMDMTMKLDLTAVMEELQQQAEAAGQPVEPLTAEEQAMFDALANEGIGIGMRADLAKGLMYMSMSGSILEQAGMPADAWYSMDMAATYAQLGMDWSEIMAMAQNPDYKALVDLLLQEIELTDATTDYAMLKLMAEKVAELLSDASFVRGGDKAVNTFTYIDNEVRAEIVLTLNMKNDKVVGYEVRIGFTLKDETGETVMNMAVVASVDENDRMEAGITIALTEELGIWFSMEGGYTRGNTAPVTEPPAGATVVPYESLMAPAA